MLLPMREKIAESSPGRATKPDFRAALPAMAAASWVPIFTYRVILALDSVPWPFQAPKLVNWLLTPYFSPPSTGPLTPISRAGQEAWLVPISIWKAKSGPTWTTIDTAKLPVYPG